MNGFDRVAAVLPGAIAAELEKIRQAEPEEVRIRLGRRACVLVNNRELFLETNPSSQHDIKRIIEKVTGASYHMAEATLCEGYINYNGLRIGVCGNLNIQKGQVHSFRSISSLSLRIPKECRGICDELIKKTYGTGFESTLIISPPGGGKTTALRELCRRLSDKGYRVSIVDERNELFADDGLDGFDLGAHSDVLSGISKAEGSMMLLRSMNPQIIVMDEITKACDIEAIAQIAGCGVHILASAHARDVDELRQRILYRNLIELNVFKYIIKISGSGKNRRYLAERIAV